MAEHGTWLLHRHRRLCRASMIWLGVVCSTRITTRYRTRQYNRNGHGQWAQPSGQLAGYWWAVGLEHWEHNCTSHNCTYQRNALSLCPISFKHWWRASRRRNAQTLCRLCVYLMPIISWVLSFPWMCTVVCSGLFSHMTFVCYPLGLTD